MEPPRATEVQLQRPSQRCVRWVYDGLARMRYGEPRLRPWENMMILAIAIPRWRCKLPLFLRFFFRRRAHAGAPDDPAASSLWRALHDLCALRLSHFPPAGPDGLRRFWARHDLDAEAAAASDETPRDDLDAGAALPAAGRTFVRACLLSWGYPRIQILSDREGDYGGARELLVALAWLCATADVFQRWGRAEANAAQLAKLVGGDWDGDGDGGYEYAKKIVLPPYPWLPLDPGVVDPAADAAARDVSDSGRRARALRAGLGWGGRVDALAAQAALELGRIARIYRALGRLEADAAAAVGATAPVPGPRGTRDPLTAVSPYERCLALRPGTLRRHADALAAATGVAWAEARAARAATVFFRWAAAAATDAAAPAEVQAAAGALVAAPGLGGEVCDTAALDAALARRAAAEAEAGAVPGRGRGWGGVVEARATARAAAAEAVEATRRAPPRWQIGSPVPPAADPRGTTALSRADLAALGALRTAGGAGNGGATVGATALPPWPTTADPELAVALAAAEAADLSVAVTPAPSPPPPALRPAGGPSPPTDPDPQGPGRHWPRTSLDPAEAARGLAALVTVENRALARLRAAHRMRLRDVAGALGAEVLVTGAW